MYYFFSSGKQDEYQDYDWKSNSNDSIRDEGLRRKPTMFQPILPPPRKSGSRAEKNGFLDDEDEEPGDDEGDEDDKELMKARPNLIREAQEDIDNHPESKKEKREKKHKKRKHKHSHHGEGRHRHRHRHRHRDRSQGGDGERKKKRKTSHSEEVVEHDKDVVDGKTEEAGETGERDADYSVLNAEYDQILEENYNIEQPKITTRIPDHTKPDEGDLL